MELIYLVQQSTSRVNNGEKSENNPGVIKMIQYCQKRKNEENNFRRRKGGNSNGTCNTSSMSTKITQTDIAEFHTSQPDENSIPVQVQMPY